MKAKEFIDLVAATSALDIELDDASNLIARVSLPSNMLPIPQPDTQHTYDGEGYMECEAEYLREATGIENLAIGVHLDIDIDGNGVLNDLAIACVEAVMDQQYTSDDPIQGIEIERTVRPNSYNYRTDSYDATWTVNLTALAEWVGQNVETDIETIMCEKYKSRSGFLSYVPGYFQDEPEWANLWGAIHLYIEAEMDPDALFMYVAEQEHEIYSEHTEWQWMDRAYMEMFGVSEEAVEKLTNDEISERIWNAVYEARV